MIRRLCVAVLVLLPTTAFAQGNPGPFGGFFGRTPERAGGDYTVFEARTSSGAQYDDPVFEPAGARDQRVPSGALLGSSAELMFDRNSERLRLQLRSSGAFHYFLREPAAGGTAIDQRAIFSTRPTTRLELDASAAYTYQPFFSFEHAPLAFEPGVLIPTSRYIARALESHSVEGTAGFTSYYSKSSSLFASVSRRETRFVHNRDVDFKMNGVHGGWRRQLSRDLALRLEYDRERIQMRAGDDRDRLYETIDVGVDFTRSLSLSRRTTINFRTETAMMRQPPLGRFFRLNGGVTLESLLRRSWRLTVTGQRTTDFVAGFAEPLLADTLGLRVNGLLSKRTELLLQADGGRGRFGFDTTLGRFTMGNAMAQVSFALTRRLGVFAQHALMYYEWPDAVSPIAGVAAGRQMTTVGITTWIPLYTRERSPSDSR